MGTPTAARGRSVSWLTSHCDPRAMVATLAAGAAACCRDGRSHHCDSPRAAALSVKRTPTLRTSSNAHDAETRLVHAIAPEYWNAAKRFDTGRGTVACVANTLVLCWRVGGATVLSISNAPLQLPATPARRALGGDWRGSCCCAGGGTSTV